MEYAIGFVIFWWMLFLPILILRKEGEMKEVPESCVRRKREVGGNAMIRKWRNSRQITGYQRLLAGAVAGCRDGAEVVIDLKTAKALIEICEQAAHTERNHEPNQ